MTLLTFLALSCEMPSLTVAVRRYSLPDCCGSPASSVLSEICRLTSFSLKTSSRALAALLGARLDDDRLAGPGDLGAGALEVVAGRRLLGGLVQGVVDLLAVDLAHDVERRVSHAAAPCYRLRRTREGVHGAGCPSGQREQTVNLPAQPTKVRTLHPPHGPTAPDLQVGGRRRARLVRHGSSAPSTALSTQCEQLTARSHYGSCRVPRMTIGAAAGPAVPSRVVSARLSPPP